MKRLEFDAIVVGSGATGGWAAKELCEAGLRVAILEAGAEPSQSSVARSENTANAQTQTVQRRCYAYNDNSKCYFIDDTQNPYTAPLDKPFSWIRPAAVGGKSLLWAGGSYRMSNFDFKAARFDGYGEEWPISYAELEPFYEKIERVLNVIGSVDQLPQLPDGSFVPATPLDINQDHLRRCLAKLGKHLIPARISSQRPQRHNDGHRLCIYCGGYDQQCSASVSSNCSTLVDARNTGRLTLITNSIVRHIVTNKHGTATGVHAIRKETNDGFDIRARLIFLCASTLESTRIMLNSTSSKHPDGFANSSGALGHFLMDHLHGITVTGCFKRKDHTSKSEHATGPSLLYIPRWHNLWRGHPTPFLRGYAYHVSVKRPEHLANITLPCGASRPGLRLPTERKTSLREDMVIVELEAIGEMLSRYDNHVQINPDGKTDAWGVPILDISCTHGDNEAAMVEDIVQNATQMIEAAGGRVFRVQRTAAEPGLCIHEAGTCRMGDDPKKSVLNAYNQCHEAKNVFVTDGSCFPSQGTQNPTLTMMALTARACRYAVTLLRSSAI